MVTEKYEDDDYYTYEWSKRNWSVFDNADLECEIKDTLQCKIIVIFDTDSVNHVTDVAMSQLQQKASRFLKHPGFCRDLVLSIGVV